MQPLDAFAVSALDRVTQRLIAHGGPPGRHLASRTFNRLGTADQAHPCPAVVLIPGGAVLRTSDASPSPYLKKNLQFNDLVASHTRHGRCGLSMTRCAP